jgi:Na+-transporting NADH:ubiquinone oxidoreductase subunit NqrC
MNEESEDEKNNEFERYSWDKLITEFFLQKFILWKSDIVILVIGNISLTEQKLLYTVKQEVKNLDKNKQIFVIHNLKEYTTEEQINDYIENTLKKYVKLKLKKRIN